MIAEVLGLWNPLQIIGFILFFSGNIYIAWILSYVFFDKRVPRPPGVKDGYPWIKVKTKPPKLRKKRSEENAGDS